MSVLLLDEQPIVGGEKSGQYLDSLKRITVGSGQKTMRLTGDGLFLGADNFADAPFSVDYEGLVKLLNVILSGGTIKYGKTSFIDSVNAGYIVDSNGFYMGSASDAKYIKYDKDAGTITIRGTLNAEDIVAGIITGRTLRTAAPAAGVGSSVVIVGGTNEMVHFYYNATETATIKGYTTEGSEQTYLELRAASGRSIKLKDSMIEIDGDLHPDGNETQSMGTAAKKWDNVYCNQLWQQDDAGAGGGNVYDFAYVEKGLIGEKVLKAARIKSKGLQKTNGFIPSLKLPFRLGTVLKWTSRGLRESKKETDFVIAIADKNGLPIVLGAEPVRIIGKAKIGDFIVPSDKKGCAKAVDNYIGNGSIGRCLENKKDNRERQIKVMIKF